MTELDLQQRITRKASESARTIAAFFDAEASRIVACAQELSRAIDEGATLYVMGNGGSACDAAHVAVEFMHPVLEKRPAWPAIALSHDTAMLTAVGNDRDFSLVFASQLRLLGKRGDIALGISTSGDSANVHRGLLAAREIGMRTVGFSGRAGGRIAEACDHPFVVPSYSIHRIQECHQVLLHMLWDTIHLVRGAEDVL